MPWEEENVPPPAGPRPRPPLRAGWHRLPVRLRGAKVYRVTPPGGGEYWHAEMTLNGTVQCRRCASEPYALWWIAALEEAPSAPEKIVMVELVALYRGAACRHG